MDSSQKMKELCIFKKSVKNRWTVDIFPCFILQILRICYKHAMVAMLSTNLNFCTPFAILNLLVCICVFCFNQCFMLRSIPFKPPPCRYGLASFGLVWFASQRNINLLGKIPHACTFLASF